MRLMILCLLLNLSSLAQQQGNATVTNTYRYFEVKDGLPQMQVWSLTEDSHGFLWVCTKDGLARWDGLNFHTWNSRTPGFGPAHARELIQVGTDEYFTLTGPTPRWIKGNRITGVCLSDSITKVGGIYKLNDSEVVFNDCEFNNSRSSRGYFNSILYNFRSGKAGKMIKTKGRIICVADDTHVVTYFERTEIDKDTTTLYLYTTNGELADSLTGLSRWPAFITNSGSSYGLSMLVIKEKGYKAGAPVGKIYQLSVENRHFHQREIVLRKPVPISDGAGCSEFIYINDTTYSYLDTGHYVHMVKGQIDNIYCKVGTVVTTTIDHNSNLWLGSEHGLYCFYSNAFRKYDFKFSPGRGNDNIWSITQDLRGIYYIAEYDRGIYEYNDHSRLWRKMDITLGSKVRDVNFTRMLHTGTFAATRLWNGGVFLPLLQGFGIKDEKGFKGYMPLPDPETYGAVTDSLHKCIYVAQYYHLYRINSDHSLDTICSAGSVGMHNIMSCTINRQGSLYFGGAGIENTIVKYENGVFIPLVKKCRTPISMSADANGNIWIAALDSFYFYDSALHAIHIPTTSLFNSVKVYDRKWLLIGTNKELILLDMAAFYKNGSVVCYKYDYANGFNATDCSQNSMLIDNAGSVWVPTMTGLIRFNPLSLAKEHKAVSPIIEDIYFSGKDFRWQADTSFFSSSFELSPKWRNLQFSFIAANIAGASRLTYRYRLDGYNSGWSSPTTNNIAVFNDLPPGTYTFEVCASTDGVTWGEPAVSQTIVLRAALHENMIFRVVACTLLFLLICLVIVALTRRGYRKKIAGHRQNMQIWALKFQAIRSKAIPHFSSNVFNNIEYLIERRQYEDATRYLALLSRLYNYILRDAESASHSLAAELEFVTNYLLLEKLRFKDALEYEIQKDEGINMNFQVPNMVLHTYVENAIKHGIMSKRGHGKVIVRVIKRTGGLLLQVQDNGIGRQAAKQYNIHSSGQGLSILSQQIQLYNSTNKNKIVQNVLDLTDNDGQPAGVLFEIFIPEEYNFS